jgi:hypothetical protein
MKEVDIQFALLQNCDSIKNGPEAREGFRTNLGSFSYDHLDQIPPDYLHAVDDLLIFKWYFLKNFDSWEYYQVTNHSIVG